MLAFGYQRWCVCIATLWVTLRWPICKETFPTTRWWHYCTFAVLEWSRCSIPTWFEMVPCFEGSLLGNIFWIQLLVSVFCGGRIDILRSFGSRFRVNGVLSNENPPFPIELYSSGFCFLMDCLEKLKTWQKEGVEKYVKSAENSWFHCQKQCSEQKFHRLHWIRDLSWNRAF